MRDRIVVGLAIFLLCTGLVRSEPEWLYGDWQLQTLDEIVAAKEELMHQGTKAPRENGKGEESSFNKIVVSLITMVR